ncbi:MAG: alanine racemase [Bifidobacteriaceae bacterium]|jgi:alanine racemase|nr:alanine racemase [Bifidobacteriaceae bacterium]
MQNNLLAFERIEALNRGAATIDYPAKITVNLNDIRKNTAEMCRLAGKAKVLGCVKADAYGHGLMPSALATITGGATYLGVAQPNEAIKLRESGVIDDKIPILAWLITSKTDFMKLLKLNIEVAIHSKQQLEAVINVAKALKTVANVHIAIDTGFGRGGWTIKMLDEHISDIKSAVQESFIKVRGIYSHLAFAKIEEHPMNAQQTATFESVLRKFDDLQIDYGLRHLSATAGLTNKTAPIYDMVRIGAGIYGLNSETLAKNLSHIELHQAMRLESETALIKDLPKSHGISYEHIYKTTADTKIAVIPVGYADGIPRSLSSINRNGTQILVGKTLAPIVGRVCMDQFMLDLGKDSKAKVGDNVTIFGKGLGIEHLEPTPEYIATMANMHVNELLTQLGSNKIPKFYEDFGFLK